MIFRTSLLSALLFISVFSFAQNVKNTVILYNVVPLNVDILPDGTIKNIYGKAYDRFKGYQLVRTDQVGQSEDINYGDTGKDLIVSTTSSKLYFDDNMATLTESTIAALERIKESLFLDPQKKIIITSYSIDASNKKEEILLQNRLASCLSYLEILGVSKRQIVLDSNTQKSDANAILAAEVMNSSLVKQD